MQPASGCPRPGGYRRLHCVAGFFVRPAVKPEHCPRYCPDCCPAWQPHCRFYDSGRMTGDVHHGVHAVSCVVAVVAGVHHLRSGLSGLFRRRPAAVQFASLPPAFVSAPVFAPGEPGGAPHLPVAGCSVAGRKPAGCRCDDLPGVADAAGCRCDCRCCRCVGDSAGCVAAVSCLWPAPAPSRRSQKERQTGVSEGLAWPVPFRSFPVPVSVPVPVLLV